MSLLVWKLGPEAVLGPAMGISAVTSIAAGWAVARSHERRRDVHGERSLKRWRSRVGRWLFRIAGLGLRPAAMGAATYRRTELAIGLAADRLFAELPKAMQQRLRELPGVVHKLEADAQQMRGRVEELNRMLAEIGEGPSASRLLAAGDPLALVDQREALRLDLASTRDAAQRRLADAVAALETIRLDLLRMQAGAGSVESITEDLAKACELSDDIERLLEGQRDVERVLQGEPPAQLQR